MMKRYYITPNFVFVRIAKKTEIKYHTRAKKNNVTSNQQKTENVRIARKKLILLLHSNFSQGDYFVTFTYSEENLPADDESFQKDAANIFRKLKRACSNNNEQIKYIYVKEESDKENYHIHAVIKSNDTLSLELLQQKWNKGMVNIKTINSPDLEDMASYLTKGLFDSSSSKIIGKAYYTSLHMDKPYTRDTPVSSKAIFDEIVETGYTVKPYTDYRGVNPFTGNQYREYTLLPININHLFLQAKESEEQRYGSS